MEAPPAATGVLRWGVAGFRGFRLGWLVVRPLPLTTNLDTLRHEPSARVGTALAAWAVRGGRRIGRGDLRP